MSSRDVYFSAHVETDGPVPGKFSMLSLAFAVSGRFDGERFEPVDPASATYYVELRPISHTFDAATLARSGLDREQLKQSGVDAADAMETAHAWVSSQAGDDVPVLVAYPLPFTWTWLYWYFMTFGGASPFGDSQALDIQTTLAIVMRRTIAQSGDLHDPDHASSDLGFGPNGVRAAIEQAAFFSRLYNV